MDKNLLFIGLILLITAPFASAANECPASCCGEYIASTGGISDAVITNPERIQGVVGRTVEWRCKSNTDCGATAESLLDRTITATQCPSGCDDSSGTPICKTEPSPPASETCPDYCCTASGTYSLKKPHQQGTNEILSITCASPGYCGLTYEEANVELRQTYCTEGCDTTTGRCKTATPDPATAFDCQRCCEDPGPIYCNEGHCFECSEESKTLDGKGCYVQGTYPVWWWCRDCGSVASCASYDNEQACLKDWCEIGTTAECEWDPEKNCTSSEESTEDGEGGLGWGTVVEDIKTAIKDIVCTVYCILLYIVAGIVALVIIIAGMNYMTTEDASGRAEARKRITYSLGALIIILIACPMINLLFGNTVLGVTPCACPCGLPGQGGEEDGGEPTPLPERCYSTAQCEAADSNMYCKTDNKCHTKISNGEACDISEVDSIPALSCKTRSCQSNYCAVCYNSNACPIGYTCLRGTCVEE